MGGTQTASAGILSAAFAMVTLNYAGLLFESKSAFCRAIHIERRCAPRAAQGRQKAVRQDTAGGDLELRPAQPPLTPAPFTPPSPRRIACDTTPRMARDITPAPAAARAARGGIITRVPLGLSSPATTTDLSLT